MEAASRRAPDKYPESEWILEIGNVDSSSGMNFLRRGRYRAWHAK
jgi:hypothetical protein